MRRLFVWLTALSLSLAFVSATPGCKRRRRKHKKYKKWRKKHKKWKKKHRAVRTTLKEFLGDSSDVYFAGAPVRVGFTAGQVANILGPKEKKKFKTPQGKIRVKVNYDANGKVMEVKANMDMSLGAVMGLAKAKWGPPTKSDAQRTKWEKGGLKIILKLKQGQVKLSIKKSGAGGSAAGGATGATGPPLKIKLGDLIGDKKDVYFKGLAIKLDQPKAEAEKVVGPTGKKNIETEANGKGLVKVTFSQEGKVAEIKLKLEAKPDVVLKLAMAKWGKPKKKDAERTKWLLGKGKKQVKVIYKVKDGKTIVALMRESSGPALKKEM